MVRLDSEREPAEALSGADAQTLGSLVRGRCRDALESPHRLVDLHADAGPALLVVCLGEGQNEVTGQLGGGDRSAARSDATGRRALGDESVRSADPPTRQPGRGPPPGGSIPRWPSSSDAFAAVVVVVVGWEVVVDACARVVVVAGSVVVVGATVVVVGASVVVVGASVVVVTGGFVVVVVSSADALPATSPAATGAGRSPAAPHESVRVRVHVAQPRDIGGFLTGGCPWFAERLATGTNCVTPPWTSRRAPSPFGPGQT